MALLKCKMCGGDLEIIEGSTVCICEYCGTKQTVPTLDNEKKIALFTRANRLRLGSEFDKAYSIYESILIDYPEEAEAYWGLVLCKYGIEYVDDPKTVTKVPTCHRSSFESIFDDSNFELAIEYADATARAVYREEAKAIEEIRKGIIEISSHEEPYDIFICYKETDEGGSRTIDSVIAQDVYDALVSKGYRVFFARISLEDKLGKEYEPYIFSALHSSKVMLVFGTDYEYFNAVWVKNEWSRFLKLIETDKEKALIPCYKDIDAYDMPKEFRKLQAQDMGKVGAIQDLLRGIGKILSNKKQAVNKEAENTATTPTADIFAPFLKKAKQQLKNGKFEEAKISYQKVLEFAPTLEEALVGSFLSAQKVSSLEKLEAETSFFNTSNEYLLLCESASDELNAKLSEALEKIKQNNISALDGAMHSKRFDDARTYIENLKSYDSDSVNEEELYFLIDVKASSFEELENGTVAFYDNKIYKSAAGDFKARLDDALSKIEGNIKKAKLESVLSENNVTRVCDLPDSYLVKNCKRLDWIYEIISEEEGQALRERISSLTTNNKKKKPLAIIAVLIVVALAVIIAIVVGVSAILISRLNNNGDTSTDTENTDTGSTETDSTDTDSSGNEGGENEGGNDTSSDSNTGNEGDNAGNEGAGDNNTGVGGEGTGNEDPTTLIIPDGTVAIKSGEYANNTTITKVVIPSSVKTIDASAFSGCTSLESVTIPNGVTSIADEAFEGCTNLTSLEIPSSVTEIGNFAFKDCTSLTIIVIPDSVTSVGDYAFRGCINVTNIVIPGETTVIGQNAFDGCSKVESATVPSTVISYVPKETLKTVVINAGTSIEDEAFKDCISLTTVEIPNSVTSIGESAFSGCARLATVTIPNNVESIGNEAFEGCISLTNIEIPNSVTSIGEYAFSDCTGLINIQIPSEVASIGYCAFNGCTGVTSVEVKSRETNIEVYAFKGCTNIESATIPTTSIANIPKDSLKAVIINDGLTIEDEAFKDCQSLVSVVISDSVATIGKSAFSGCIHLENIEIPNTVTKIGTGAFSLCTIKNATIPTNAISYLPKSSLQSVVINGGISIGNDAFKSCTSLTSIKISSSVESIATTALTGCTSLKNIIVEEGNPKYTAINDILYCNNDSELVLVKYAPAKTENSFSLPENVTSISSYAFDKTSNLETVILHENVTSIDESAFYDCESIRFNNYDTAYYLGNEEQPYLYLIEAQSSATSCKVHENTKLIASKAFSECGSSLKSIEIPNSEIKLAENTFFYCNYIESATIPTSAIEYIPKYNLKSIVINSGSEIEEGMFSGCYQLTEIILPETINNIDYQKFQTCSESIFAQYDYAKYLGTADNPYFYLMKTDNMDITSCTIHPDTKVIGVGAFGGCLDLCEVEIPNGVTTLCEGAFGGCFDITSITIPSSVASIADYAFASCVSLSSVTVLNNSAEIGKYAFSSCENITSITLPAYAIDCIPDKKIIQNLTINGGTSIDENVFNSCTNLTTLVIGDSVTTIEEYAFAQCSGLTSVTLGKGLITIGNSAFERCYGLPSIVVPEGVTSIGNSAFGDCTSLTSVVMPSTITTFGISVFYGSNSITSATMPSTVAYEIARWAPLETVVINGGEIIAEATFQYCDKLTSVTILDGVTTIGAGAFASCSSLESVVIPNSVTSIGEDAFVGCTELTSVTIGDGVTSIGIGAFTSSPSLKLNEYDVGLYLGTKDNPYAYLIKVGTDKITSCFVNKKTKLIADGAFYGCNKLTTITVPSGIIIGESAFVGCGDVEINEMTSMEVIIPSGTVIVEDDYAGDLTITSVIIPDGVTTIGERAFAGCTNLNSIVIPDSVTSIGTDAFKGCNNIEIATMPTKAIEYIPKNSLKTVTINGGDSIGSEAFASCTSLTSIEIPNSVTSIGARAFWDCDSLESVTIPNTVASIGDDAFYHCDRLTSVTIPDSVTSIGATAFENCRSLTSIVISNSVLSVGIAVFIGCDSLTIYCEAESKPSGWDSYWNPENRPVVWGYIPENDQENDETILTIPVGTVEIPDRAYENNTTITTLIIPEGVTHIGASAFQGCVNLTNIIMPNTVISIGEDAFAGCDNVVDYDVPSIGYDHIPPLKSKVFVLDGADMEEYEDNTDIERLVVYGDIGYGAFSGCTNLKYVEIMDGVEEIQYSAFAGCTSLKSVTISSTVTSIWDGAFANCTSLEKIVIPKSVTRIDGCAFQGCTNLTICCEAESMPSGWDSNWNPENRPVVWGYTGE